MRTLKKNYVRSKELLFADAILSLIVVTQNDGDIVGDRLKEINRQLRKLDVDYEILVVDNNSLDNTIQEIRKVGKTIPYIRTLRLSKQYDKEIALTAGLDNCIGDYAVLFNIYLDPPIMLQVLVNKLLEDYDVVIGRPSKDIVKYGFLSRLFLKFTAKISTHGFYYSQDYLIALNRKAINSITRTRRKSRNFSYINYLIGFKKCTVPYKPLKVFRHKLEKESFPKLFLNVVDIIISNSFRPIRMFSFLGMLFSLLFIIYIFIIVLLEVVFGKRIAPQGWISVATVLGTMFFLLFSLLTLISEYIIRIMNESRNEPLYFIADEIDKSVILRKKRMVNVV